MVSYWVSHIWVGQATLAFEINQVEQNDHFHMLNSNQHKLGGSIWLINKKENLHFGNEQDILQMISKTKQKKTYEQMTTCMVWVC